MSHDTKLAFFINLYNLRLENLAHIPLGVGIIGSGVGIGGRLWISVAN